jgi:subtilisin family serine protease
LNKKYQKSGIMKKNNNGDHNPGRYIVMLEKGDSPSINKVERDFSVSITSSEDLSSENRSFNILSGTKSIFYKNLNVVVMEDIEPGLLNKSINDTKSPVIFYEKDRIFTPANELDLIRSIRSLSDSMQEKLLELEEIIKKKAEKPKPVVEMEWGLKAIGLDRTPYTGQGVDICILDTGFDARHADFSTRTIEGKSFVPGEAWDEDIHGHGTHCAGVAAGNKRSDNEKRYGIAPGAGLKIAKVLSASGSGTTSSIVDAIDWAITKKYRVISLSLGSPVKLNEPPSLIFERAGETALENNCLIIAAAGNDSRRPSMPKPVSCPANSKSIIAVAAIDEKFRIARFSNGGINAADGGEINVCAPGVDVLSCYPSNKNNYTLLSGTSMAAPHVSGMAALYMEAFPDLTARQIWQLLEEKAIQLNGLSYLDVGKGLIQAI